MERENKEKGEVREGAGIEEGERILSGEGEGEGERRREEKRETHRQAGR